MPQTTQHFLIHILLLWTTVLSIIQIVLIILFFTAGHNGLSHNSSAVEAQHKMQSQEKNLSQNPPGADLLLGKGKMLSFKASSENNAIKWASRSKNPGVVSAEDEGLLILRDGYYFLNFQVTLSSCKDPNDGGTSKHTVRLTRNNSVLLEGRINTETNSTGLLGKVEQLSAGGVLKLNIIPSTNCINESESVTHLDIIYMVKP